MMFCTTKTLKYILYLLDFMCAILGVILASFGKLLLEKTKNAKIDNGENLTATFTIVLGVVIVTMAFYGCLAIHMESKSMLIGFAVVLVVLLIIQLISFSISYAVGSDGMSKGLRQGFDELWDPEEVVNGTLSYYETWLQCCGKHSPEDYLLLDKIPPASCCKDYDCTNIMNLYMIGCEQKFKEYASSTAAKFNIISFLLIVIEFFGSILACVLVDSIRNHRDRIRLYS